MARETGFRDDREAELARCVLDEVDEARDVFRLGRQLIPLLPIKSFDQLRELGAVEFRGRKFETAQFAGRVPSTFFPIEDMQKLVVLLQLAVRMAPGYPDEEAQSEEMSARLLRRASVGMAGGGRIGPPSTGLGAGRLGPIVGPGSEQ